MSVLTTWSSLPTIPATWTAPASCFASTNYYRVLLGGGFFSNMYGTPTPVLTGNAPTGSCFPPSFTIDVPYLTDGNCPSGYTLACATGGPESRGQPVSTVTCCPSVTGDVFSFMCRDNQYGCHATATPGAVWTGVITDLGLPTPTEQSVTRTPFTDEGAEAWGIKFISVAPTTTSTSSTSTTSPVASSPTTSTASTASTSSTASMSSTASESSASSAGGSAAEHSSGQSSLPTRTVVGIAIGSAIGVGLVAIGAFLFYRMRQRRVNYSLPPPSTYTHKETPALNEVYQLNSEDAPHLLDAQDPRHRPVWEMYG